MPSTPAVLNIIREEGEKAGFWPDSWYRELCCERNQVNGNKETHFMAINRLKW